MANDSVIVDNSEHVIDDEGDAGEQIDVAALVEYDGGDLAAHGTEAGPAAAAIAGLPFDPSMSLGDSYGEGERVRVRRALSGVATRVQAAEAVSADDLVVSAGDGSVRAAAGDGSEDAAVLGQAVEGHDGGLAVVRWF